MPKIYLNVISSENFDIIKDVKTVFSDLINPPSFKIDKQLIEKSKGVFMYAKQFPMRVIENVKLSYNNGERLIVYFVNTSENYEEWYSVSIIDCNKSELPLVTEKKLSREFCNIVEQYYEGRSSASCDKLLNELIFKFMRDPVSTTLENLHYNTLGGLEEIMVPLKEDSRAKLDFFIIDPNGFPLTNKIFRYYYTFNRKLNIKPLNFFKLDMNRRYNLSTINKPTPLHEIHKMNCMSLSAFNTIIKGELGGISRHEDIKLKHLSTKLHNNYGTGFTLFEELKLEDINLMLVLDVKNKYHSSDSKYVNKLFGFEREKLEKVKEEIIRQGIDLNRLCSENQFMGAETNTSKENDKIFNIVKKTLLQ